MPAAGSSTSRKVVHVLSIERRAQGGVDPIVNLRWRGMVHRMTQYISVGGGRHVNPDLVTRIEYVPAQRVLIKSTADHGRCDDTIQDAPSELRIYLTGDSPQELSGAEADRVHQELLALGRQDGKAGQADLVAL